MYEYEHASKVLFTHVGREISPPLLGGQRSVRYHALDAARGVTRAIVLVYSM